MSLSLYFLRHGQTTLSRDNMFCGAGMDPDLTPDGVEMAECFATAYRSLSWRAIYSSPQKRALATIAPLATLTKARVAERNELKEIAFGRWDGQSVEAVTRDYHDDHLRWSADPAWNAPTGGETVIALARRSRVLIEEIRTTYDSGAVLLVSHKATIRVMLCDLLGIDLSRFRDRLSCPVGSLAVVEFGARGPLLTRLADRGHLTERLRSLPGT